MKNGKAVFFLISMVLSVSTAQSAEMLPHSNDKSISLEEAGRTCILATDEGEKADHPSVHCEVNEFRSLGSVEGYHFYYALYFLYDKELYADVDSQEIVSHTREGIGKNSAIAIFEQSQSGHLSLLWQDTVEDLNIAYFSAPTIVRNPIHGYFLFIPQTFTGTGGITASSYFHWRKDHWESISVNFDQLRLPKSYRTHGNININLETLSYDSMVYTPDDSGCCAKGGSVYLTFKLVGNKLEIDRQKYTPQKKAD